MNLTTERLGQAGHRKMSFEGPRGCVLFNDTPRNRRISKCLAFSVFRTKSRT